MNLFIGIVLLALALFFLGLQRAYHHVPLKELRRQARANNELARALYHVASYGYSLRALLLSLSIVSSALLYLFIARNTEPWLAALIVVALLWFMYVWLPAQTVRSWMVQIAGRVAPAIASVLQYVHPVVSRIHEFIRKHRPIHVHSGMYETEDIIELLEAQRSQLDNRIPESTIGLTISALTFADKPIQSICTPRRVVHSVNAEDTVGPILMSELHDSGFSRFPVYEGDNDNIVGILFLRDLVSAKKGGKIKTYMQKKVCYIHEEQTLRNGLDAILKTHQQLFIVVNSFEEYIGVVSIEDILEEVLGQQIVDEFDAYDDMRAVAASQAKKDNKQHDHPAGLPETVEPEAAE